MLKYLIIIFIVGILNSQIFSQDSGNQDSSEVDTLKSAIHFFNFFYDINLMEPYYFYDNELKKWNIFLPRFSLKSRIDINSKYLLFNDLSYRPKYIYSEDKLESYKESMKILLAMGYEDYSKYDLRALGEYLGISRKIMAIILGILTLLKK